MKITFCINTQEERASEICGKDKHGKELTVKLACCPRSRSLDTLHNRSDRRGAIEYIDFTDYKALPMDPVDCFEKEQTDSSKYDELMTYSPNIRFSSI